MPKKQKIILFPLILLLLATLDQATKNFLISYLNMNNNYILHVSPILDLIYVWNHGISFGLFKNYYQYSNLVFLIINSFLVIYLTYATMSSKSKLFFYGITIIIGGAIGNLIDRVFHGAVFDFIYFHYHHYHFPAFNLADSFITIGVCLVTYEYFLSYRRVNNNN